MLGVYQSLLVAILEKKRGLSFAILLVFRGIWSLNVAGLGVLSSLWIIVGGEHRSRPLLLRHAKQKFARQKTCYLGK